EGKIPFQEKSVGLTLLCDHGKSMIHCFLGTAEIHQLIVKVYPACCPCPDTEDGLQKLSTSGSHQTIKSENFTFPHIKGNILEMRFELCRQMLDRKDHVLRLIVHRGEPVLQGTANHGSDQFVHIGVFCSLGHNQITVTEYGNIVTY